LSGSNNSLHVACPQAKECSLFIVYSLQLSQLKLELAEAKPSVNFGAQVSMTGCVDSLNQCFLTDAQGQHTVLSMMSNVFSEFKCS